MDKNNIYYSFLSKKQEQLLYYLHLLILFLTPLHILSLLHFSAEPIKINFIQSERNPSWVFTYFFCATSLPLPSASSSSST